MNRTIRAIVGAGLVLVIIFSAMSITQNIGTSLKLDITDQQLYTLSDGTKSILGKKMIHEEISVVGSMTSQDRRDVYAKCAKEIRMFQKFSGLDLSGWHR